MPKYVLILSGDHIYKMNYQDILEKHVKSGAQMTVSCIETPLKKAAGQFGVMNVDDGDLVLSFEEKPIAPSGLPDKSGHVLASMGNYVFNTDFLIEQLQKDALEHYSSHDFGKDIIPKVVAKQKVQAFRFCTPNDNKVPYWRDVGTLDAYWEANMALLSSQPSIDLCDTKWPIWSTTGCLQPARFLGSNATSTGRVCDSLISAGCIIHPSEILKSLVFEHSTVGNNAHISHSVLLPKVKVGNNVSIKNAIIDSNCVIPDNLEIGENRKEDLRRGFRISSNGIVLVTQKMLQNLTIKQRTYLPIQHLNAADLLKGKVSQLN